MKISFSKGNLSKIESLFKELNYKIRYERGNFQSGYCLVNDSNIIIINKFFDTKSRIEALLDILSQVYIDNEILTDPGKDTLNKILKLDILSKKMVA